MAAFSITDFYPSDLLSDLKLKPWWETVRGYGYAAGVASMMALLVATFPQVKISCFPDITNLNDSNSIMAAPETAINSYCIRYVPWYIASSGLFALAMMVLLYFMETFWTLVPGVTETLTNLSKVSNQISEINMRVHEMKTQSVQPITNSASDKELKLREIVMLLIKPFNSVNVMAWYTIRSILLSLTLTMLSAFNMFAYLEFDFEAAFSCDVQSDTGGTDNTRSNLSCIVSASSLYLLLYSIALIFQAGVMLVGLLLAIRSIWSTRNMNLGSWEKGTDMSRKFALRLLSLLLTYMNPDLAKDVDEFSEFVLSEKFMNDQCHVADLAIIAKDFEFFRILKTYFQKIGLEDLFADVVTTAVELLLRDAENHKEYKTGATDDELEEKDADCKIFTLLLNLFPYREKQNNVDGTTQQEEEILKHSVRWSKNHQWHILACSPVLQMSGFVEEISEDMFDRLDIKFDQLDEEGRSFLYYALRNSTMNRMLTRFEYTFDTLMKKTKYLEEAKFVHFDGKSVLTSDFILEEYANKGEGEDYFRGKLPDISLCEVYGNTIGSCAQTCLADIYDKYLHQSIRITDLESMKFRFWNEVAVNFAKTAYSNNQFNVLMALLNSNIVTVKEREKSGKLECGVYDFTSVDCFKEALKRPTGKPYFVPTAARHVLACFNIEQRKEAKFHVENSNLSERDKRSLYSFIHELNEKEKTDGGSRNENDIHQATESSSRRSSDVKNEHTLKDAKDYDKSVMDLQVHGSNDDSYQDSFKQQKSEGDVECNDPSSGHRISACAHKNIQHRSAQEQKNTTIEQSMLEDETGGSRDTVKPIAEEKHEESRKAPSETEFLVESEIDCSEVKDTDELLPKSAQLSKSDNSKRISIEFDSVRYQT